MTMSTRIRGVVRGVRSKAQASRGRAKQTAGRATGNNRLRRRGKVEELQSRLSQFTNRIREAVRR